MTHQKFNLFDSLEEGIQIISPEFKYLYINTALANQVNLSKEKILEKGLLETFPIQEKDTFFQRVKECMKRRTSTKLVGKYVGQKKKIQWLELKFQPFEKGVLIMSADITNTQLKLEERINELAEALERENKLKQIKSSYLSEKAHELKVPVGLIKLSTNVLKKMVENADTTEMQKYHDYIQNETKSLLKIIDNLVVPIQKGINVKIFNYHTFDIFTFLKKVINQFQEKFGNDMAIQIQEEGEPMVELDSIILRRILITLLKNLILYAKKGINIKLNIQHRRVLFEITTIGIEIPQAEDFFEIQNNNVELNIVKNYIELLEGIIRIKSENKKGTIFTILFPIKFIVPQDLVE